MRGSPQGQNFGRGLNVFFTNYRLRSVNSLMKSEADTKTDVHIINWTTLPLRRE